MSNLRLQIIGFVTIYLREVRRIIRIWPQTILPPIITISLYFLVFGKLLGAKVGLINNQPYMSFITPGLIMMGIINNSYVNVASSFFITKFQRHIEEMLVSPLSMHAILLGYIISGAMRGVVIGLIVILVAFCYTSLPMPYPFFALLLSMLTAILFSLAGFINAVFANKFDDISIIPAFIIAPFTYLGGIFYSLDILPPFWQTVTKLNPIFYMISGLRYGILGVSEIDIWTSLSIISVVIVVVYVITHQLMIRGIGLRN